MGKRSGIQPGMGPGVGPGIIVVGLAFCCFFIQAAIEIGKYIYVVLVWGPVLLVVWCLWVKAGGLMFTEKCIFKAAIEKEARRRKKQEKRDLKLANKKKAAESEARIKKLLEWKPIPESTEKKSCLEIVEEDDVDDSWEPL